MSYTIADVAQKVGLPVRETKRWLRQMGVPMEGDHLSVDDETVHGIVRLLAEATLDRVPTPPEPPHESIEVVLKRHTERLRQLPGVVGIGIRKDAHGQPYLNVLLSIPLEEANLPAFLDGYPVKGISTGRIVARSKKERKRHA